MEDFLKGIAGIGVGFMLFLPSHVVLTAVVEGGSLATAPIGLRVGLFGGLAIMFSSPIIFWGLKPLKDKIVS